MAVYSLRVRLWHYVETSSWRWLTGSLSLCGVVACSSFAPPFETSATAEPGSAGTGGTRGMSLPPAGDGAAAGARATPSDLPQGLPAGMPSMDEGSSSTPRDAGSSPATPDPAMDADASAPSGDPTGPVDMPDCSGLALDLDGASFAVVPRMVENDFTLEAWIKTSASRTGPRRFEGLALFDSDVIGQGSDFLSTISNDRVAFGIGGSADVGVQGVEVVTTGEWMHVALTRNAANGQLRIFVNGSLDGSATGSNLSPLTGQPNLAFGGASNDHHFLGSMDEIRVWNIVRSAEEISANMRVRLSGSESGLVGYYTFEDRGEGQTADASALGIPATLVGNPSYVTSTALCSPAQAL